MSKINFSDFFSSFKEVKKFIHSNESIDKKLAQFSPQDDTKILELISLEYNIFAADSAYADYVLYPGSFNPLHEGHKECIRLCPEKVLLILDRNPQKQIDPRRPLQIYLEVLQRLSPLTPHVYPGFLLVPNINPTASWLDRLQRKTEQVKILMGDDSFMSLDKWIQAEVVIKKLSKIYVVPRNFKESEYHTQFQRLKKINSQLKVDFLADHPYKDLASSELI